jgi:hypothetical protein
MTLPPNVFDRCLHILKHRGPAPLLRCYDRLPAKYKEVEAVQKQMQYFGKRLSLMQYPDSQRAGWLIVLQEELEKPKTPCFLHTSNLWLACYCGIPSSSSSGRFVSHMYSQVSQQIL